MTRFMMHSTFQFFSIIKRWSRKRKQKSGGKNKSYELLLALWAISRILAWISGGRSAGLCSPRILSIFYPGPFGEILPPVFQPRPIIRPLEEAGVPALPVMILGVFGA